jgi:hypothetical protein
MSEHTILFWGFLGVVGGVLICIAIWFLSSWILKKWGIL